MMTMSPQEQNKAVAHSSLELLSNASLLKKVMDNTSSRGGWNPSAYSFDEDERTTASMASDFTPPKSKGRKGNHHEKSGTKIPPSTTSAAGESSGAMSSGEKSSSTIVAPSAFMPPSYAALLAGSTAGYHHHNRCHYQQLSQLRALAQLPHFQKGALSMLAAKNSSSSINTPGGAPSSAFQKPPMLLSKENVSPQQQSPGEVLASPREAASPSYEALLAENLRLKEEAKKKDESIAKLQEKADGLEEQIVELRQLPTGKISHIPIEDMIRIMQEYGSEVSNQTLTKRKQQPVQKASIVRQFRRWNPEFFRYFVHVNGEWVPRLGKQGELKRRQEKRRSSQQNKKTQQRSGSPGSNCSNSSVASTNSNY